MTEITTTLLLAQKVVLGVSWICKKSYE